MAAQAKDGLNNSQPSGVASRWFSNGRISSATFQSGAIFRFHWAAFQSASPAKKSPETNPYIRTFRRIPSWVPGAIAVFAGKIDYQRYGPLDRQVIRLTMWLTHGPTDAEACVEFTDWPAVDRFAQQVGQGMQRD